MIRHVFKLMWKRKRSTGLILCEILICFLVLCGILATGIAFTKSWLKPLGFDYENVWSAAIQGMQFDAKGDQLAADRRALSAALRAVQAMTEVEAAAVSTNTPYSNSSWIDGTRIGGKPARCLWTLTSPDLPRVLRMRLLHGRWIEATDGALSYEPVVLSRSLARDLFGTEDPIGRDMPVFNEEGEPVDPKEEAEIRRVVGVMDDYRRRGMLEETAYTMFIAVDFDGGERFPQELLIRVRPGTTAAFEEKLVRTLRSAAPQWSYDTTRIESRRRTMQMSMIGPLLLAAIVAAFLIATVGLGLVGVLWLGVTRRTSELGLRRAMGASAPSVRRQILGELWALTAVAVAAGAAIFLQLPLLGVDFGAGWWVFLGGATSAALVMYAFVTVCGLYPAWLASRVQPAAALQHE